MTTIKELADIIEKMECPDCKHRIVGYTDKSDESEWLTCKNCGWAINFGFGGSI